MIGRKRNASHAPDDPPVRFSPERAGAWRVGFRVWYRMKNAHE